MGQGHVIGHVSTTAHGQFDQGEAQTSARVGGDRAPAARGDEREKGRERKGMCTEAARLPLLTAHAW